MMKNIYDNNSILIDETFANEKILVTISSLYPSFI